MSRQLNRVFCQVKPASRRRPRSRSVVLGLPQTNTFMPYSGLFARYTLGPASVSGTDGLGEGAGGIACDDGPATTEPGAESEPITSKTPSNTAAANDATFRKASSGQSDPQVRTESGFVGAHEGKRS